MNGVSLARNLLVRFKSLLPSDLRTYYQPFIYGLVGGLSAVAFQVLTQIIFRRSCGFGLKPAVLVSHPLATERATRAYGCRNERLPRCGGSRADHLHLDRV